MSAATGLLYGILDVLGNQPLPSAAAVVALSATLPSEPHSERDD